MSDNKVDVRTIAATNNVHKTSLTDFLKVDEPVADDTTVEESTDETVVDESTTEENVDESTDDGVQTVEQAMQLFEVKGKKVPVKDLINSYETREEISRRFDEAGKKEQRIAAEREKIRKEREELDFINEKFEEMREQVLAGNPLAAMQIALALGVRDDKDTSKQTMEELINQAITIADNFHGMTDEEKKIFLKKEEIAHKEREIGRREKKQAAVQKELEIKAFYESVLDVNKITDDEVDKAYDDIVKDDKFREELEKKDEKGKISYCASWVLGKRLNSTLDAGIAKVAPKLVKDPQFRLALLDVIDPRCTVEDVAKIVQSYLNSMSNGSAQGESAASTQSVAPKKPTTSNRAPTEKPKAENKGAPITSWKDILAKHGSN